MGRNRESHNFRRGCRGGSQKETRSQEYERRKRLQLTQDEGCSNCGNPETDSEGYCDNCGNFPNDDD